MRQSISQLSSGVTIAGEFFAVQDVKVQSKKDGAPYLRARLRDATGTLDAVSWEEFDKRLDILRVGRVVKVRGPVGKAYNGTGLELTIAQVRPASHEEYQIADFLPRSDQPTATLRDELDVLLTSTRQPLQAAIRAALDPELARFALWPAAQEIHHAWLGGLLEHSLEVTRLAIAIADVVPNLDRDLLIAGALLHDIGKLDAYDVDASFRASDAGRLLGHVLAGFHRVQVACQRVELPNDECLRLLHIVASHHGQLAFGAAREPMIPEAIVIHYADELSAQLMQMRDATGRAPDGARWTERVKGLGRDVFLGTTLSPLHGGEG
ncbi:MAG TPA: HD domain-containing protein [Chloroflexota bacterium]|nr:HD domain-containing protein [Chloroflexota bacterium]